MKLKMFVIISRWTRPSLKSRSIEPYHRTKFGWYFERKKNDKESGSESKKKKKIKRHPNRLSGKFTVMEYCESHNGMVCQSEALTAV